MKIPGGRAVLTFPVPSTLKLLIETKNDINFYFHTFLWCLKKVLLMLEGPLF